MDGRLFEKKLENQMSSDKKSKSRHMKQGKWHEDQNESYEMQIINDTESNLRESKRSEADDDQEEEEEQFDRHGKKINKIFYPKRNTTFTESRI